MRSLLLIFIAFALTACEPLAVTTTPPKMPVYSNTSLSRFAQRDFWRIMHHGDYASIDNVKRLLLASYLENPNDPYLAAHIGYLHIWKITERNRNAYNPPTIVDEIILSRKYFQDATEILPMNAQYHGFLADSMLVEGKIFNNKRQQVKAYFRLKQAIKMWPEFNYFTAGYPLSTLPAHSEFFQEALAWQWRTLDWCTEAKVNRRYPNYARYLSMETHIGPKRVCWNSWVAPHNFEGFFLNMGDMLVKNGDWRTGRRIYQTARLSRTYNRWPYRNMLEKRIRDARINVKYFRDQRRKSPEHTIMFDSGFGCMVCHKA